jgi:NAD(P)-dependent dehydrogenase (short-subunit alcohol dehydrogenase family)
VSYAIVTGGSRGIGRAVVSRLRDLGYEVAFTYVHFSQDDRIKLNNGAVGFRTDMTDAEAVGEFTEIVDEEFGADLGLLVNNAGIMEDKSFQKMTLPQWDSVLNSNLSSLFTITRLAVDRMIPRGQGRIVNIASVAGVRGYFGKTNYCASKSGVIGMTKALSLELAKKGITVNAVAPGMIETDMTADIPEKYLSGIIESIPMGRFGTPGEVAACVEFFASEHARYVTGQVLAVAGGMDV